MFGVNAVEVPRPAATRAIKSQEPLVLECREELDYKKWIARSPAVNRLCEREDAFRLALKGFRDQLHHVLL